MSLWDEFALTLVCLCVSYLMWKDLKRDSSVRKYKKDIKKEFEAYVKDDIRLTEMTYGPGCGACGSSLRKSDCPCPSMAKQGRSTT